MRRTCIAAKAQTLEQVFPLHTLPALGGVTIEQALIDQGVSANDLVVFLKSIDSTTPRFRFEGDVFRDICARCTLNPTDPICPLVQPPSSPMLSSQ